MNSIIRVLRGIPESYILSIPQMFHMVILAGFIPWYIGVEDYGRFAAVIAIPGLFQSFFEAYCVSILLRYKQRAILRRTIVFIVIPLIVFISVSFFLYLPLLHAVLTSAATVALFCRSYTFAIAISSGSLTRVIATSEGLIFLCYIIIALLGIHFEIRDITLPIVMIGVASAISFLQLQHVIRDRQIFASMGKSESIKALPLNVIIGALLVRAFEDGLLTLSPLVLALTVSTTIAGQFRILVSAIKVVYKLFPFRYEVVMRDVGSGDQSFHKLSLACVLCSVSSVLLALIAHLFIPTEGYQWLLPLVAVSGAVVSCLAVYPVSCVKDRRISPALMVGIVVTYLLSFLFGIIGFVVGFSVTSYSVMASSLIVIRKELAYSHG